MLILLTGEPGVGKSTVLMRLIDMLKEKGISVGGVVAREVRDAGKRRVGFEFVNVIDGSSARLASLSSSAGVGGGIEGPRIGKYSVDLDGCRIAAMMLLRAINSSSKVVVFDEIGPMELLSSDIVDALRALLDAISSNSSSKYTAIVVIHKRFKHWIISRYREMASIVIEVNRDNRDALPLMLLNTINDKWDKVR
ncbi:Nucleoside-triphosphatase THEP1 [archaeon HR05]|nr:Nucleoside-triphosphatase THEP1 [archaeon HR05]